MTRETVANVAPFTPREEVQDAIASATHYFTSALQKTAETGRLNTELFPYKSFPYDLKHRGYTKISIISSIACARTRKYLGWIIILRCLCQVRETIYTSTE